LVCVNKYGGQAGHRFGSLIVCPGKYPLAGYLIFTEETVANPNPNDMSVKEILLTFNCLAYDPENGTDWEVMVIVLDSGVEPGDLMFKRWSVFAYNGRSSTQYLQAGSLGYDFVDSDPVPNGQLGHGMAVSGAVIGQYRGKAYLSLVNHKIIGDEGFATHFGAIEATYAAIDHGTDFINMSWGITQEEPTYALGCALE
jgi:hypothetical protein